MEKTVYLILVDVAAVLLLGGGIVLVAKPPKTPATPPEEGDPRVYARRLVGTVIAAFGLAIGMMVTLFHFLSQGS